MRACDNKLRSSLVEAMRLDEQRLEAEMQGVTPHVFPDIHEQKMEKLMRSQNRKRKVRGVLRYAVAACLVLLLTGSILIISSEDLRASKLSVDIIEWLEDFFSTEKGIGGRKKDPGVLFEASQIGYLPEGFEKVEEAENISRSFIRFENKSKNFIHIIVGRDKSLIQFDNFEDTYEIANNKAGYEFTGVYSEKTKSGAVVWQDKNGIYYFISGTITYEEIVKVMNGITY